MRHNSEQLEKQQKLGGQKGMVMGKLGEQVLVATVGVEPQVVTLTLDALQLRGFPITAVYIVHTNPSHPAIANSLRRLMDERQHYKETVRFFFVPVRDGNHYPQDFLEERDVALLLRVLYKTVAKLKRKGKRVHLSIAGGRKVMTAMGMVVAQLLLDEKDYVWHLLSEGMLPQTKEMHPKNPDDVVLVPVPVLRWALLPSTVQEILVWDDPYRAIERQRQLQAQQQGQLLNQFWSTLTPAEREVVTNLVLYKESIPDLSRRLNRSPKTVANQLKSVYDKYRNAFNLPPEVKVRERLIVDLAFFLSKVNQPTNP